MKLFSLHRYVSVDMETLLTLQEIAKQLKRLADAWEGEKSEETKDETDPDDTAKDPDIAFPHGAYLLISLL